MRVLHVVGPTEHGGAQTQLLGVLRAALAERLWDPALASLQRGPLLPAFVDLGVPVLDLRRLASPGFARLARLRRHIQRGGYDVVHALLPAPSAYTEMAVAGRRDRPAVVVSERGVEPRSWRRTAIDRVLDRWADVHAPNGEAVADFVRSHHRADPERVVVVPNAVDRHVFTPRSGGREPGRIVGSIGRLVPMKGYDVLVDAVRRISGVEVRIAGEGAQRGALEQRAAGLPVTFAGRLTPGEAVADFLRDLDVFVLPARGGEGQPNAVLEALACAIPVVATDIPGMGETARGAAVLVPPDDPDALADAIRAVLADPSAPARAAAAAAAIPSFGEAARAHLAVFERARRLRAGG